MKAQEDAYNSKTEQLKAASETGKFLLLSLFYFSIYPK